MKTVNLFAGVEGIGLGFARAGIPTLASVEIDKHARGVIADRVTESHLFTDVTEVSGHDLRAAGADPDRTILTGGFPCQDLSIAGRRAGMARGTRSGLFWGIARLLGEFRPAWVVLENVPGLLSSNDGRDMGAVLGALGDRGYGFAYRVLDAQFFGVAQRRRRVVIVGHLGDDGRTPASVLFDREGVRWHPAPFFPPRADSAAAAGRGAAVGVLGSRDDTLTAEGFDASEDGTGRGVPIVAFHAESGMLDDYARTDGLAPTLNVSQSVAVARKANAIDTRRGGADDNEAQGGHLVAFQEATQHPDVREQQNVSVRRLTPRELERLQGFPDDWTLTSNGRRQSDSQRAKQMGNSVAVPLLQWVAEGIKAVS